MKSLHFGFGNRKLYGVYHPPLLTNPIQKSILICSSIGPEYVHPYRLLRILAENLANKGHHIFRFDWYGCGDSCGESSKATTGYWISDAKLAAEELCNLSGNQKFSVIGLRLGATIAWNSFIDSDNLPSLFLWEPIIDGAEWINEMISLHSLYLRKSPKAGRIYSDEEILGYPLPSSLKAEICSLKMSCHQDPKCKKIHLLYSDNSKNYDQFCRSLKFPVTMQNLNTPEIWTSSLLFNKVVMSHPAIKSIVTYFDQE